jgi:hypothetical protein
MTTTSQHLPVERAVLGQGMHLVLLPFVQSSLQGDHFHFYFICCYIFWLLKQQVEKPDSTAFYMVLHLNPKGVGGPQAVASNGCMVQYSGVSHHISPETGGAKRAKDVLRHLQTQESFF